jgi:hypothetical protein
MFLLHAWKEVLPVCSSLEKKTDIDFFIFFLPIFGDILMLGQKSGRIFGIRLLDMPDIRPNQYPVHPY